MVGMRNFKDTFEARKGSFISAFSICMTVTLIIISGLKYKLNLSLISKLIISFK